MRYELAALWRRTRNPRKRIVTLRPVIVPSTLASDLFSSCYRPVITAWEETIPTVLAEYERSLGELTQDSPADIGQVLSATEDAVLRLILTIRLRLEQWGFRVERLQRAKWSAAVKAATGVDISAMIGPQDARTTIGASIERNVGLIKSVSEQARTRIGESVFRGLQQRKPARQVAAEIREATAMARRRSINIAGDQLSKISASLNEQRAMEAGLEFYEWVHSRKLHPREVHKARDGKRFKYGQPAGDTPGQAVFCGCTSRAVLSLDSEF